MGCSSSTGFFLLAFKLKFLCVPPGTLCTAWYFVLLGKLAHLSSCFSSAAVVGIFDSAQNRAVAARQLNLFKKINRSSLESPLSSGVDIA